VFGETQYFVDSVRPTGDGAAAAPEM